MARFAAFLDACVLVQIVPCDTLLRMADSGAFRPLWSARVIEEAQQMLRPPVELPVLLDRLALSGAPKFASTVRAASLPRDGLDDSRDLADHLNIAKL